MKEKKTSSSFVSLYLMMMMKREEEKKFHEKKYKEQMKMSFFWKCKREGENIHSFVYKIVATNIIKMERIKFKKNNENKKKVQKFHSIH